jgi:hypothetical protein
MKNEFSEVSRFGRQLPHLADPFLFLTKFDFGRCKYALFNNPDILNLITLRTKTIILGLDDNGPPPSFNIMNL